MVRVLPFKTFVPSAEHDIFTSETKHPSHSCRNFSTPTVVLSNDRPVCDKYSINLQNIREFIDDGVIQSLHEKSFLIYSQTVKGHRQIGICAAIAVEDCLSGTIKRHEKVTKEVVDAALAHHKGHHKFKTRNVDPVMLMYRQNERVQEIVSRIMTQSSPVVVHGSTPLIEKLRSRLHKNIAAMSMKTTSEQSCSQEEKHCIWAVTADRDINELREAFGHIDSLYIADGHHRTAAACRMVMEQERNGGKGPQHAKFLLGVMFPHDQLSVIPYNRCVSSIGGKTPQEFLDLISTQFVVREYNTSCTRDRVGADGRAVYSLKARRPRTTRGRRSSNQAAEYDSSSSSSLSLIEDGYHEAKAGLSSHGRTAIPSHRGRSGGEGEGEGGGEVDTETDGEDDEEGDEDDEATLSMDDEDDRLSPYFGSDNDDVFVTETGTGFRADVNFPQSPSPTVVMSDSGSGTGLMGYDLSMSTSTLASGATSAATSTSTTSSTSTFSPSTPPLLSPPSSPSSPSSSRSSPSSTSRFPTAYFLDHLPTPRRRQCPQFPALLPELSTSTSASLSAPVHVPVPVLALTSQNHGSSLGSNPFCPGDDEGINEGNEEDSKDVAVEGSGDCLPSNTDNPLDPLSAAGSEAVTAALGIPSVVRYRRPSKDSGITETSRTSCSSHSGTNSSPSPSPSSSLTSPRPSPRPSPIPTEPHHFSMYFNGRWFDLCPREAVVTVEEDPLSSLDVQVLTDRLLRPVLGIECPRTDSRMIYVAGGDGIVGLETRVNSGEAAVAFYVNCVSVSDIMRVADAGQLMPPKATCFDPKPLAGFMTRLH